MFTRLLKANFTAQDFFIERSFTKTTTTTNLPDCQAYRTIVFKSNLLTNHMTQILN